MDIELSWIYHRCYCYIVLIKIMVSFIWRLVRGFNWKKSVVWTLTGYSPIHAAFPISTQVHIITALNRAETFPKTQDHKHRPQKHHLNQDTGASVRHTGVTIVTNPIPSQWGFHVYTSGWGNHCNCLEDYIYIKNCRRNHTYTSDFYQFDNWFIQGLWTKLSPVNNWIIFTITGWMIYQTGDFIQHGLVWYALLEALLWVVKGYIVRGCYCDNPPPRGLTRLRAETYLVLSVQWTTGTNIGLIKNR